MIYQEELTRTMTWLGEKPDTIFIGQQTRYPGNALYKTLQGVPMEKRVELPVAEEMQMGMSIGLAMKGKTVISIYPRMDFLMCAMNQLVNHLDKDLYQMTGRVIIRTCVGSTKPMYPGVQHCGNYTKGLWEILKNTHVVELQKPEDIFTSYMYACGQKIDRPAGECGDHWKSSLMIEFGNLY